MAVMKKYKKGCVFGLIGIILLTVAILCWHRWETYTKFYPVRVLQLPAGFINLRDAVEEAQGIIKEQFFEEYVSLIDKSGFSVGGSLVRDRTFIVDYYGVYYINAEKFYSALEKAERGKEEG